MPDLLDFFVKYIVFPLGLWNWRLHTKQNEHKTEIEVMKAQVAAAHSAQSAAEARFDKRLDSIISKLDSIEQALRK